MTSSAYNQNKRFLSKLYFKESSMLDDKANQNLVTQSDLISKDNWIKILADDKSIPGQTLRQLKITNNVIVNKQTKKIYLPGYLRMKVKNFTDLNLQNLDAQINASIVFNVYYGLLLRICQYQLNQSQKQMKNQKSSKQYNENAILKALQSKIILQFAKDQSILLSEKDYNHRNLSTTVQHNQSRHEIKYTVRKLLKLQLTSQYLFCTPLQHINSILQIKIQPIKVKFRLAGNQEQEWTININLMDLDNSYKKISYGEEVSFGNYGLRKCHFQAFYTNYALEQPQNFHQRAEKAQNFQNRSLSVNKIKNNSLSNDQFQKLQQQDMDQRHQGSFNYAYFNVALYKYATSSILIIFIPLFLLSVINLGIFFQDSHLGDRIGSISALLIAFIAFIPTIRSQITPNPHCTCIQTLVYFEICTCLLALIQSLRILEYDQFKFQWRDSWQFISSLFISCLCVFSIVCILLFYMIKRAQYNTKKQISKSLKFQRYEWRNSECDNYFINNFSFTIKNQYFQIDSSNQHGKNYHMLFLAKKT